MSALKPGKIVFFAKNTAPDGYLKCNGAAVSRTTYATLFAAIGTTFGAGNGSTTFNLPDLRGEFLRCWDDSRGVDSGRVFGSFQDQAYLSHTHNATGHANLSYGFISGGGNAYFNDSTTATSASGETETRPRNRALLACIKY